MKYTMNDRKDNKVHRLKSIDELILEDNKDLFIVKLDGSKLHTFDEFNVAAKAVFQTSTDESMIYLQISNPLFSSKNQDEIKLKFI